MDFLAMINVQKTRQLLGRLLFVALQIPLALQAQQNEAVIQLKTRVASLVASPGFCEFNQETASCVMEAALIWEVPKAGSFCLWDEEHKEPLQCWDNNWSGTHQLAFESGNNKTYLLTRGPNGTVAAKATIKVLGILEQRLRAKRRRGFWRMF